MGAEEARGAQLGDAKSIESTVWLPPGGTFFGSGPGLVRTLLGSCVAVTMWHARLRVGGMCHYLLPSRGTGRWPAILDGRYADEALSLLAEEATNLGTEPTQYRVRVFGAGRQFAPGTTPHGIDVPERNIEAALVLLELHGFVIDDYHVGGYGPREVILDLDTGVTGLRHGIERKGYAA